MKIILADTNIDVVDAWKKEFDGVHNVYIHNFSIFNFETDAIVSPANSFGFMDGGIDLSISCFFYGFGIQNKLQDVIKSKHHGELVVGKAEIIETEDDRIPYVISAPTMRVPMSLPKDTVNPYLATRAVFELIEFGKFEDSTPVKDKVRTVSLTGMGTGVGGVAPTICARQMKEGIMDVLCDHNFPNSWKEAYYHHINLYSQNDG